MAKTPLVLCEGASPAQALKREEEWYRDIVKPLADRWEPKMCAIKVPEKPTQADRQRAAFQMDLVYGDVVIELRKAKAVIGKLEEGIKYRKAYHKRSARGKTATEKDGEAMLEVAKEELPDALFAAQAKYNYVRGVENRLLWKRDMLRLGDERLSFGRRTPSPATPDHFRK